MQPVVFANDPQFWFETLRTLGHAAYGGADIGEVLTTAQRITAGDYDSWHDQWLATANRIAAEAQAQLAAGHRVSARDGLLRASNYYRAAEFFLHGNPADPRIGEAFLRSARCFRDAAALFIPAIEPVEIPYEDTVLHGYFYRAAGSAGDDTPGPRWSCTAASTALREATQLRDQTREPKESSHRSHRDTSPVRSGWQLPQLPGRVQPGPTSEPADTKTLMAPTPGCRTCHPPAAGYDPASATDQPGER